MGDHYSDYTPVNDSLTGCGNSDNEINNIFAAEKENIFELIFEESPIFIVCIDNDGSLLMMNKVMLAALGYSDFSEVRRCNYLGTFVPRKDRDKVSAVFKELVNKRTPTRNINSVLKKNGKEILVEWQGRPIFKSDGNIDFFVGMGMDVTEKTEILEKLKHQNNLLATLFKRSIDAIVHFDKDNNIIDINDNFHHLFGYNREEIQGMDVDDALDLGQPGTSDRSYTDSVLKGGNIVAEGVRYNKAGEPVDVLIKGIPIFINGVFYGGYAIYADITAQKSAERALLDSEQRYRDILAAIKDGYFETDLQGNITFCNKATAEMLGYSIEELIGLSYKTFCADHETVFKTFNRLFKTGKTEHTIIAEIIKNDGSNGFGELTLSLIKGREGSIAGFRGVGRDVTERKQYEEQLKYLSMHDQLTGLYNRSYFENELTRLAGSREFPVTIMVADLDGLKLVNDTIGHEQGDRLLITSADILKNSLRDSDILARLGGDEFVILLPKTTWETGKEITDRIQTRLSSYNRVPGNIPISLSMGFATAAGKGRSLQQTFKEADDGMYRDKLTNGSNAKSNIIDSLINILGDKDFFETGHPRHLEDICAQIGKKIYLNQKQIANLQLLARVHDLGKVGIADHILFKKGALEENEWEEVRQHPEKGYRIALASNELSKVADLVLKHHEKWDGSGYPLGLKGDEIPIECRIFAIADAFDAMTNNRPYRKAMSRQAAFGELKANAGKQFDPGLVKVFLSAYYR